ncbi:MAG: hypothetical protein JWO03_3319 [Bacteroidetes bacterium]|nr:hypothetical protein [Bacteroidota bacterium]
MIKRLLFLLAIICCFSMRQAQAFSPCGAAFKQVIVNITPDNFPQETSWSLHDDITGMLIDSGTVNNDTICVDTSRCLRFTMFDTYGDGICCSYGIGSYTVKLNGVMVAHGASFAHAETTYFNCRPGHDCNDALVAVKNDTIIAPIPDTWYVFTPDSTGLYNIFTCGMGNTCDTKIYVYDHCTGLVPTNDNQGTMLYNDDNCPNNLSLVSGALQAHTTYYIRIGQYDTSCAHHTIHWRITFQGPIAGCMDTASCNYNPLATISDNSCVYPPNALCPAPDLAIDVPMLHSSLYLDSLNVNNGDCYVNEGCLAGYGERRLLRFTTHIRNIGNQDYFIGAPDTVGNQFVYDPCHQHWHYVGYAEYLLYDRNNQQVQVGFKNGFCVLDLECSGGGTAKFGCGNMGITAGCGDIYNSGLACQWLDITQIDTGDYTLVVRVNWNRKPDKLGHYESRYDNNWSQICLRLYYDAQGRKMYDTLPTCPSYVDCAGDTFGSAALDCAHTCGGSAVRGDLNVNLGRDAADRDMYLNGMTDETLAVTTCNDLNGDGRVSVIDAARLNGCLRKMDSTLTTLNNPQSSQHLCEFPYNVYNPLDSVTFSVADVDWQRHYIDLSVYNPMCKVMGYELKLSGMTVDSVKNLAVGNYTPIVHYSSTGHITELSNENEALFKQLAPLNFLRVYFSHLVDSTICIANVIDVANENYQQVLGQKGVACVVEHRVDSTGVAVADVMDAADLRLIPNPSSGSFELFTAGKSLYGASIHIYDAVGKIVYENKHNDGMSNEVKFDLTDEASGVYLLQINLNGASATKRFVIRR